MCGNDHRTLVIGFVMIMITGFTISCMIAIQNLCTNCINQSFCDSVWQSHFLIQKCMECQI